MCTFDCIMHQSRFSKIGGTTVLIRYWIQLLKKILAPNVCYNSTLHGNSVLLLTMSVYSFHVWYCHGDFCVEMLISLAMTSSAYAQPFITGRSVLYTMCHLDKLEIVDLKLYIWTICVLIKILNSSVSTPINQWYSQTLATLSGDHRLHCSK